MKKGLTDVPGACDFLCFGRTKLLELTYAGDIPSVKIGRLRRFSVEDLERWIDRQSRTVPQQSDCLPESD